MKGCYVKCQWDDSIEELVLKPGYDTTYLQQIVSRSTLLRVDLQGQMEEVTENVGQLMLVLDLGGSICGDQVEGAKWRFGQIRWFTLDHFNGHDTQTPDVDLATVLFTSDDLGRHPVRGTDHGVALVVGVVDLGTETEIGYTEN